MIRFILSKLITSFVWILFLLFILIIWLCRDLPNIEKLGMNKRKPCVTIQDRNGKIIGTYGDFYEGVVHLDQLPLYVPQAILAVEDKRFYSHFGLDIIGMVRAFFANVKAEKIIQGGSSITQQLAKNLLVSQKLFSINDKSIKRKVQEALVALWLEWKFSKDQILTIYLNRVYFGSGAYGIAAASRKYFNKHPQNLTILESAILAGLLKAPSRYSPIHDFKQALIRARVVLQNMIDSKFIPNTYCVNNKDILDISSIISKPGSINFFNDWIYETFSSYISNFDRDVVITTTLDLELQSISEKYAFKKFDEASKQLKVEELGFILMDKDGAIKSLLGGRNYSVNQYNHSTQALRQAGSTFKIFVYLAALELGLTPDTLIEDTPFSIGDWDPQNFYLYKPKGEITLEEAFSKSVNTASVRLAQYIGTERIISLAHRLGITSNLHKDLSIALGSCEVSLLELTSALATIANKGYSVCPYGILEIKDKDGLLLYKRNDNNQNNLVIDSLSRDQIENLLINVIINGTGRAARINKSVVAGKTGSNRDRDAWFIGYILDGYIAGVWVGNDDNKPMDRSSTGGKLPAMIWKNVMQEIIKVS